MTIHWRPSRTHQRRGVLSHILSLKFCAVVVSRSWTHSMDRQSSLHEDIYLRSANGYGFCMILFFFRFGKGVFCRCRGVQHPFQMFLDFVRCTVHCCVLHFRLWFKQFHAFASYCIFGYSGASCDVQRIEKLEKNDNIRKMKSASETWSVEIVRNCALDYTLQPAWLS